MPKRVIPKRHEGAENIVDGESCPRCGVLREKRNDTRRIVPRGEVFREKGNDTRFQIYKRGPKEIGFFRAESISPI